MKNNPEYQQTMGALKPVELHDGWARLIGIPVVSLVVVIVRSHSFFGDEAFLSYWLLSFITTFMLWEGNGFVFLQLRKRLPHYHQTSRRLIIQTLISLVFTYFTTACIDLVFCPLILGKLGDKSLFAGFQTSLLPTLVVTLIYESAYFFNAWKMHVKKTEALARENIQSQLETLKNQLDPHFLFNSLNTLASLIDEDNLDAQKYLEQLSDVYRYVLVNREKNTVSLEEEMGFLDAYLYLNKIRFRENLLVEKHLSAESYSHQIAPLSLQMLVENAIKHNIVSKESPLRIRISEEDHHYLSVENNIQAKKTFEKSTKVGLQNIINRYHLLTGREVEITHNTATFKVNLPLL